MMKLEYLEINIVIFVMLKLLLLFIFPMCRGGFLRISKKAGGKQQNP